MIAEGVVTALRQEGFAADWVSDGVAATEALRGRHFDVVLLDLGLPKRDGLDILRELRGRKDATPVIVVTARDEVRERVAGLNAGADDYLVKPFDLDELIARTRSLLRRSAGRSAPVMEHGGVRLDPVTRAVWNRDLPVVLSRQRLEDRIYGWDDQIGSNAVEVYIHALRRKLGSGFIRTLRGVGYCIPLEP